MDEQVSGIIEYEIDADTIESVGFNPDGLTKAQYEEIADRIALALWDRATDLLFDACSEMGLDYVAYVDGVRVVTPNVGTLDEEEESDTDGN